MGRGVREKKERRDVERLSRGQSHDLLVKLENAGLAPALAAQVIDGDPTIAFAMVRAIHSAMDVDFGLMEKWRPLRLEEDGPAQLWVEWRQRWDAWSASRIDNGMPQPSTSLEEIVLRNILGYRLCYRPSSVELPSHRYLEFPNVRGDHWEPKLAPFGRPAERRYWFWIEVTPGPIRSERRQRRGNRAVIQRPSIEEYLIAWRMMREDEDIVLDPAAAVQFGHHFSGCGDDVAYAESIHYEPDHLNVYRGGSYAPAIVSHRAVDRIPDA